MLKNINSIHLCLCFSESVFSMTSTNFVFCTLPQERCSRSRRSTGWANGCGKSAVESRLSASLIRITTTQSLPRQLHDWRDCFAIYQISDSASSAESKWNLRLAIFFKDRQSLLRAERKAIIVYLPEGETFIDKKYSRGRTNFRFSRCHMITWSFMIAIFVRSSYKVDKHKSKQFHGLRKSQQG